MTESKIIMYGSDWCGDCRRARRFFKQHEIPYEWINIDRNRQAEAYVREVNRGNRSVPTIVFPDGDILVEPDNDELAQKFGLQIA
jgi:mycoredoxin